MEKYKISATGLSLNYMPQYISEELGFFAEQGLEIETVVPQPWTKVLRDIDSGDCISVCGGIWVPSMYISHGVAEYRAFAKISSKCPFKLVARASEPYENWHSLEGKTILIPCDGGASAYIFLIGKLKDKGVDVDSIRFVHDFTDSMLLDCFTNGTMGDFHFTQPVTADALAQTGKFKVVAEMGLEKDTVPWSVYYSTAEVAVQKKDLNDRFTVGLQKGLDWIGAHNGTDCIPILQKKWPQADPLPLAESVDIFRGHGMWSPSVIIGREEYENYARYQIDAGIIDDVLPYERVVI